SMYPPQSSKSPSHSLTNSLPSIQSKESLKSETLNLMNGVHLIHDDGEEDEIDDDDDENSSEAKEAEAEEDPTTETETETIQNSRSVELAAKSNYDEQFDEDKNTSLNSNNNNNHIDDKEDVLVVREVSDEIDLNCLINLKNKINIQSIKVLDHHKSIANDQRIDNVIE
ncbi:unnamed protein product, partial [Schistosoma turkestanicum]